MSNRGYIVLTAFLVAVISGVKLAQQYSTFWSVVCVLSVVAIILTVVLGMFPDELDEDTPPARIMSEEDREITGQAMRDLIASTERTN